jgi:uncharacterized LabA/DUF88 family protein
VPGSYAIFVDAAFLWASVGELLFQTSDRSRLTCDYESLVEELIERTGDACDRELLRLYWYDGAVNKVPTPEQKRVGLLPSVKLRLGRVVSGHQKGVDSLIVLDLLKVAGTKMVDVIYLLSGDDDLTEGVREAQACGVRVVLLGAATEVPRQSESMVLEADGVELWPAAVWAPHFSRLALLDAPSPPGSVGEASTSVGEAVLTFERVGYAFSSRWLEEATPDDMARVRRSRPRIPADVDARLLWDTSAGRDLSEGERVALRDGFWRALDERDGRGPAAPPLRPLLRPDGQPPYIGREGDGRRHDEDGDEDGDDDGFAGLYDDDDDVEADCVRADDDSRQDGFDDEPLDLDDEADDEADELYDRDDGR